MTLLRRLAAPFSSRAAILLYHRVSPPGRDPHGLRVDPGRFAAQMAWLKANLPCLGLRDLRAGLASGTLPRRAAAVTFDDGYVDNLRIAKPILQRQGVPATVFVATGPMRSGREFWWDELERILADDAGYHAQHRRLRSLGHEDREADLASLAARHGDDRKLREACRPMRPEEVRELAEGGLVGIGAHTVRHPVLPSLPLEAARREILDGKRDLESLLGREVDCFAYPFGGASPRILEMVRESGYRAACTTLPAPVTIRSDPFLLPRFAVRDWDVPEFSRRVSAFLESWRWT